MVQAQQDGSPWGAAFKIDTKLSCPKWARYAILAPLSAYFQNLASVPCKASKQQSVLLLRWCPARPRV